MAHLVKPQAPEACEALLLFSKQRLGGNYTQKWDLMLHNFHVAL